MCGISGVISFKNKIDSKTISKIIKSIKNRGPDDDGYWTSKDKKNLLVNTRLSIIDTSERGKQPMISSDNRHVIVFNGEIYNYNDLKFELKEYNFKGKSDTEVILYLYKKHKEHCLNYLDGMFAFAIYDTFTQELFCARDRFGIKPFYYFQDSKGFYFSSEINTFEYIGFSMKPNLHSVNRYLSSEYYEHINQTFYKNIFKLKPGHYIKFRNKKKIEIPYCNFIEDLSKFEIPKKNSDKKFYFKELIFNTISKSFVSDVPITIASSGGLDSSIINYSAYKKGKSINSISFSFDDENFSEKKYVDLISSKTNSRATYFKSNSSIFKESINYSIKKMNEPFAGLPIIAYMLLIKNKAKNKVIIDGSGLDEMHCGYDKYFNLKKEIKLTVSQDKSKSILEGLTGKKLKKYYSDKNIKRIFKNFTLDAMYKDLFYIKLPRSLRFRDKLSMLYGKEIRPAFLDKNLALSFFKLKITSHYKENFGKYFLRDLYSKELGRKICFAKKRHIQTPQTVWFRKDLKNWILNFCENLSIVENGWIDNKSLKKNLDLFFNGRINNSFFIWQIINLEIWFKTKF